MSTLVQHMTHAAIAERLSLLVAELQAAADEGDASRVSRADHAFRSAVIGLVGGASLVDNGADWRLDVLIDSLHAVRAAADTLTRRVKDQEKQSRGTLIYLTNDRRKGH